MSSVQSRLFAASSTNLRNLGSDRTAAYAAAMLINKSVEDLDSVRTRPMIEELVLKTGLRLEDSAVAYWR